jgi:hypothetical protein
MLHAINIARHTCTGVTKTGGNGENVHTRQRRQRSCERETSLVRLSQSYLYIDRSPAK